MRRPLLLFIACLLGAFTLLAFLIFSGYNVHRQSVHKLLQATDTLSQDNPGMQLMDSALLTLNDAENNFRLYTVLYKKHYLQSFSTELGQVLSLVDTISGSLSGLNRNKQFNELIHKKEAIAGRIAQLKKSTDSMLTHSLDDGLIDKLLNGIPAYKVKQIKKDNVTMDTMSNVQQAPVAKKGFFKRLGNAISNSGKKDTVKAQMNILVKTKSGKVIDKQAYDAQRLKGIITDVNGYYKNILRKQLTNRLKINTTETSLGGTNVAMLEELRALILSLKNKAATAIALQKKEAKNIVTTSVGEVKDKANSALIALLVSIIIIAAGAWVMHKKNLLLKEGKRAAEEHTRVRTDFLNNMSHEIRTPLNSIVGFSEQLSFTQLGKEQRDLLRSIEGASDMLLKVVNDVLDFSKLENEYISIQRHPFVLYHVFNDVISIIRIQANQKKLAFNVTFDGSQQEQVSGDVFRLKQILLNLISNAIKYTDKGSITVAATLESLADHKTLFSFTVADTGEGISPEAQKHVFERFYQVTSSRSSAKGTGLGLAITKRLIELHGGDIHLASEVNKGTTFTCHIPYEVVSAPLMMVITQKDIQEMTGAFMEGRYVLIADDQEMNLLLLKLMLTRWKCRFDMATDGAMAMELFEQNHYDLALLDVHMPKMTGIEVMERIRKDKDPLKANLVVLALTANITQEDMEEFRRVGFNDWLVKPFREKDIYGIIRKNLPLEEDDKIEDDKQEEA
ncbi:signal transduction histidine kinase [Chitinophaga niastensis]|uniref:histidine kinase n=1 Tax=Chitinophaga niastensis TaxID=536980 RepID=A0A2P8HDE6_CHINA|nr:ATP-binding protein [Chitinophaga niastensis]PSL44202.1 signal transduction histidine kinase [Chitinophaga niastensis]